MIDSTTGRRLTWESMQSFSLFQRVGTRRTRTCWSPTTDFEASASLENCSPRVELSWILRANPATCRSWRNEWNDQYKIQNQTFGVCRCSRILCRGDLIPRLAISAIARTFSVWTTFSSWTCCPLSAGDSDSSFEARRQSLLPLDPIHHLLDDNVVNSSLNFSNNHSCASFRFVPCPTLTTFLRLYSRQKKW